MPPPALPASDAKIGAKIDYLAKVLGTRLKPHGFARKGRVFHRARGDGAARCTQLMDLQGDKWNAGAQGRFTVNLGVCFPALLALQASLPGLEWAAPREGDLSTAFGPGGFTGRLGDAVPATPDPRWPAGLAHGQDFWAAIDAGTDLAALADSLADAVLAHALPWLDARSDLAAFGTQSPVFGVPAPRSALLAAVLQGDAAVAAQRARAAAPAALAQNAVQFEALCALLARHGVDVDGLAWAAAAPSPQRVRRAADTEALRAAHDERVQQALRLAQAGGLDDEAWLDAWLDAFATDQGQSDPRRFPLWPLALQADTATRRRWVRRALQRLPAPGPTVKSTLANVWATYANYHHHVWPALVQALLALDDAPCETDAMRALLQDLRSTVDVVEEDLTVDRFVAPVAAVLRWLGQRSSAADRYALRDDIGALADAIADAALARCDRRYEMLARRAADPLRQDDLVFAVTPEERARMLALYRAHPERAFAGADREAVLTLQRWRRAEPDGRVPLQLEDDDWGRTLSAALASLPAAQREALLPLLEWFDAGVDTAPTARWRAELVQRLGAFDRSFLVAWLAETLPRFGDTRLEHVAATPGVGTFPGPSSGRVLLGLVHLADALDEAALIPALHAVARAAFTLVPGQRVRAQSAGTACLAPLARHAAGRALLAELAGAVRQKPLRKAIAQALARA